MVVTSTGPSPTPAPPITTVTATSITAPPTADPAAAVAHASTPASAFPHTCTVTSKTLPSPSTTDAVMEVSGCCGSRSLPQPQVEVDTIRRDRRQTGEPDVPGNDQQHQRQHHHQNIIEHLLHPFHHQQHNHHLEDHEDYQDHPLHPSGLPNIFEHIVHHFHSHQLEKEVDKDKTELKQTQQRRRPEPVQKQLGSNDEQSPPKPHQMFFLENILPHFHRQRQRYDDNHNHHRHANATSPASTRTLRPTDATPTAVKDGNNMNSRSKQERECDDSSDDDGDSSAVIPPTGKIIEEESKEQQQPQQTQKQLNFFQHFFSRPNKSQTTNNDGDCSSPNRHSKISGRQRQQRRNLTASQLISEISISERSSAAIMSERSSLRSAAVPKILPRIALPPLLHKGKHGLQELGFEYRFVKCETCCGNEAGGTKGTTTTSDVVASMALDEDKFRDLTYDANENDSTTSNSCSCDLKLYHLQTNEMINEKNRKQFIDDGDAFDYVSKCCQEYIQQNILIKKYGLEFVNLERGEELESIEDLAGSGRGRLAPTKTKKDREPIQALVSPNFLSSSSPLSSANHAANTSAASTTKPTLIIIGGKGVSRAGILSASHVMISGINVGSAIYHIDQAHSRDYNIIILDPNARGTSYGMEVVTKSLMKLFISNNRLVPDIPPLYILAHSAAGGYLVRFALGLLDKGLVEQHTAFINQIQRLCFTDSTHNIQWTKSKSYIENGYSKQALHLHNWLQSNTCLYIRNNTPKATGYAGDLDTKTNTTTDVGEAMNINECDRFWIHRFGCIPTVWAGTVSHSKMCFVAREVIWKYFDDNDNGTDAEDSKSKKEGSPS